MMLIIKQLNSNKIIRFFSPIITAFILIFLIDEYMRGTMAFTLALMFPLVVMAALHSGYLAGIIVSLLMTVYGFYASPNLVRAAIIGLSAVVTIIPVEYLRRKVDNVDSIFSRLRELDIQLVGAELRWDHLSEAEKKDVLRQAKHKVGNLLTLTRGWYDLAREREAVIQKYGRD